MSDKPARETLLQNQAFLVYVQLPELSVKGLWESWGRIKGLSGYKRPSYRTLERWCSKYQWVERAKQIHNKAKDIAVKKTVEQLAISKEEVLAITRVVMIRYGKQLQDNTQGRLTILDFEKAWKIQRIELGLPIEIGKQEVAVDRYPGLSDEQLLEQFESLMKRYKEKLKARSQESFGNHVVI